MVSHFGSRRAAARAIGVDESTVRYWLNPGLKRAQINDWYHRLSGREYNRLLLRQRRSKALKRREQRRTNEGS